MPGHAHERPAPCWRRMAVIEVDASCGNLDDILEDISFDSRLEPQPIADSGTCRFALIVNASRGPDRSAMAAFALLSALEAIAEDGGLPGFRIVAGDYWLQQGATTGAGANDEAVRPPTRLFDRTASRHTPAGGATFGIDGSISNGNTSGAAAPADRMKAIA